MNPRFADIVAGLSVAGLMLPEAVAYAAIAGFAPQHAIFAAMVGGLVYAVVGQSRFAIVAPTSSSAAMLAAAIASLSAGSGTREFMAMMIVAVSGLAFLVAGYLKLGSLSGFISRPVLRGFAFGLAVTIIVKQLPIMFGVTLYARDVVGLLLVLLTHAHEINLVSLAIGVIALAMLIVLKRYKGVPGAIILLLSGVALSYLVDLPAMHVTQVGRITAVVAMSTLEPITPTTLMQVAQLALPLTLILFAESWGTMRTLALAVGDTVTADRELKALGLANLASALVQGMPVGAGFSASSANAAAGTSSRWAAAVAALGLGALLWCAGGLVARLPEPILAAIVISALAHALSLSPIRALWRLDRDQWVALAATFAVIMLGVLNGMFAAIALSVAALLQRISAPRISELGQLPGSHDYIDIAAHPKARTAHNIAIFRPNAPLFFANAERVLAEIQLRARRSRTKYVIISLEESDDFDSTALEAVQECVQSLAKQAIIPKLARVHDRVRDLLIKAGENELAATASFSVADAVAAIGGERYAQYD